MCGQKRLRWGRWVGWLVMLHWLIQSDATVNVPLLDRRHDGADRCLRYLIRLVQRQACVTVLEFELEGAALTEH